jgi:hypothetical protein
MSAVDVHRNPKSRIGVPSPHALISSLEFSQESKGGVGWGEARGERERGRERDEARRAAVCDLCEWAGRRSAAAEWRGTE